MPSKCIEILLPRDADSLLAIVEESAKHTFDQIAELQSQSTPLDLLARLKFDKVGSDPLDSQRPLNVIEQLNQTFTYIASFRAAKRIFKLHPGLSRIKLNLGTAAGSDLESADFGGVAAEVFAATHPNSNRKLVKDIEKVSAVAANYKYSFFMCPNIAPGPYTHPQQGEVVIESLGPYQPPPN